MTATLFAFTWTGRACGVNNRYVNRGYNLTSQYRKFLADLAMSCRAANPGVRYCDEIQMSVELRIDRRRDSDSLIKPLFDAIQKSGVIQDDRQIRCYQVEVRNKKRGELDEIRVEAKRIAEGER